MSDDTGIRAVRSIIAAATAAISDDDEFQNVINSTRRSFRRPSSVSKPKRRCKWEKKILLLRRSNADFCPSADEINFLTDCGLRISSEIPLMDLNWTLDELESYIYSLYPHVPINLTGFGFAKLNRQRKVIKIIHENPFTMENLKETIGQGMLVLLPNRDLPEMAPIIGNVQVQTNIASRSEIQEPPRTTPLLPIPTPSRVVAVTDAARTGIINDFQEEQFILSDSEMEMEINPNHVNIVFPTLTNINRRVIEMNRNDVISDMFEIYKDESITMEPLFVRFFGEPGIDDGGLSRELFTLFWKNIFSSANYFSGHDILIPHLPLHLLRKQISDFQILGRILAHTLILTKCFPTKLTRITYIIIGDGNLNDYKQQLLLEEYFLYLTLPERRLVLKAKKNFNSLSVKDKDRLCFLFSANKFYDIPKLQEFDDQLDAIAENIIIKEPKELYMEMKKGFPEFVILFLKELKLEDITNEWKKGLATAEKAMNCLVLDSIYTTNEEDKIYFYIQNFVGFLSKKDLENFLLFVTGGINMPETIKITFHNQIGLGRRQIAYTSSCSLELATNYDTQQEFDNEFNEILKKESSYEYSQV